MKLTNYIRDSYISSVMNDVPTIDYHEAIRKHATATVLEMLPPAVVKMYKDSKTQMFIQTTYNTYKNVSVTVPGERDYVRGLVWAQEAKAKLDELGTLRDAQQALHTSLRSKVHAAAYGSTTRKALVDLLPEFEKYLPTEDAKSKNLPAIANLMVDLVKAGWPKDGRVKSSIKVQKITI